MVHSARFKSEEARSPLEWFEWFRGQPGKDQSQTYGTMIETIYARGILSGIETRTSKSWGVQKWIGFSGVAIDLHKPKTAKLDRKRNPSKSQRGARG